MLLEIGQTFQEKFSYTQEQVNTFAQITGDHNPLHLDEAYAAQTMFKKPIIHGVYSASIFSKILGMSFPGEGTVYVKQDIRFMRPMFVNVPYLAIVTIKEIDRIKHQGVLETKIVDENTGKTTVVGEATVIHTDKF